MKKIYVAFIVLMLCVSAEIGFAQVNRAAFHNSETYVEAVLDATTLKTLSQDFSIDRVQRNADGTFNTRIWLSYKDYDNFLAREIPYTVAQPTRATVTMATNYAEMVNGWNRYPTYSTYLAMMDTFQTRYPSLCKIDTILAATPGGRKVLCAHISNNLNDNMGKPSILYISTMHGDEVVGYYFMLRLIDMLLSNYNTNTRLTNMVNNFDIWICPDMNPDGTYHTSNDQINTSPTSTRANYNSVDLNRSFPQQNQSIGSSSSYEPEVWAMMQFFGAHNFTLAANFHGGAEVFNYPWDKWTTSQHAHADDAWWQYVGRKFADTCHTYSSSYFTEENNGITEGGDWYVITGSMQDYHNWFLGTRHATIEVGDKVLSTSLLPNYWNYAYHSLLNFIEDAGYGIHGTVTDSLTGEPLQAMVYVNNHDADHSYVETSLPYGDYHRPIKGGQYSVTYSAEGYHSKTITVNVSDGAKLTKNVQLVSTDTNSCRMPKYVTVDYNGGTSAVVSWSSTAQSCNLKVNDLQISNVTSPCTLYSLASSTHYDVQVQADCGGGDLSDWTDAVGFTTDCLAQDKCELTFELTDSWGDSWNGAAIRVVDASTGEVLGELANENLNGSSSNGENEVNTKTLSVCNGKNINFVWVSGTYDTECSYVIYDAFGDVILSGSGALATTSHTVDCGLSSCAKPSGLVVVETTGSTATLSWTENGTATAWQICLNDDETNLINVTTNPYTLTGLTAETAYTAKVRANCGSEQSRWSNTVSFVPSDKVIIGSGTATSNNLPLNNYYNYTLSQQIYTTTELGEAGDILSIEFYKNNTIQCNRNLDVYMVSTDKNTFSSGSDWITVTAADKVFSGTVSFANNDWTTITLDTPFSYDGTSNVAVIVDDNTGSYKNNTSFLTYSASGQAIYVRSDGTNYNATSPSSYSGTLESTKNQIRVLIDRPEPACPAPTDVTVANVTRHSAVVSWTEAGDATSWVVSYRKDMAMNDPFTEVEVSEPSYTLSDLAEGTLYIVKVRPVCDGVTDSWSATEFTTESCYTIPLNADVTSWTENFDTYTQSVTAATGVEPTCWVLVQEDVTMPDNKKPQIYCKSSFAHSGNYSLMMNYRGIYAMPMLPEVVTVQDLKLEMYLRQANAAYQLQVGVWDDELGTFSPVAVFNNETTGVELVTCDFSGYTGNGRRIAFRNVLGGGANYNYSYNYIDDITLSLKGTEDCAITLPYNETFEGYTAETGATGVEPDCWNLVQEDVAMTDATVPQLFQKTTYAHSGNYSLRMYNRGIYAMPALSSEVDLNEVKLEMYVRQPNKCYQLQIGVWDEQTETFDPVALVNNSTTDITYFTCDFSGYEGNGRRIAFRNTLNGGANYNYSYNYIDDIALSVIEPSTNCDGRISTLPYEENFDSYTLVTTASTGVEPDCWDLVREDVELTDATRPQLYCKSSFAHSGNYSLKMSYRCVYAMPALPANVNLNDLNLSMYLRQANAAYRLEVGVWDDQTQTFEAVQLLNNSTTNVEPVSCDFSGYTGNGRRIAFRNVLADGAHYNYSYNYLDDITLSYTENARNTANENNLNSTGIGRLLESVSVYPNPTKDYVNVQCTMNNVHCSGIEVIDMYGKVIYTVVGANNYSPLQTRINVSGLAAGMYFVRVTTDQGVVTKTFVKR